MKDLNKLINAWNTSRLDLFSITLPNEVGEYFGIIRFYFQATDGKYFSKCIRISNTASARQLVDVLVEKFHPDLNMLPNGRYALYEQSSNSGERRMGADECPLKNQLNYAFGTSEVRYILRDESRLNRSGSFQNMNAPDPPTIPVDKSEKMKKSSKRNTSKTRKKETSEPPLGKNNISGPIKGELNGNRSLNGSISKIPGDLKSDSGPFTNDRLKINCSQIDPVLTNVSLTVGPEDTSNTIIDQIFSRNSLIGQDPNSYTLVLSSIKKTNGNSFTERFIRNDEQVLGVLEAEARRLGTDYRHEFRVKRRPLLQATPMGNSKSDLRSLHNNSSSTTIDGSNTAPDRSQKIHLLQAVSGGLSEYPLNKALEGNGVTIKIGSCYDVTKVPPNIYIDKSDYPDVRSIHCSILKKKDSNYLIISPALDAFTRPPGPAFLLLNHQRVLGPTTMKSGDEIRIGKNGLIFRYTIKDRDDDSQSLSDSNPTKVNRNENHHYSGSSLSPVRQDDVVYSPESLGEADTSVTDNLPLKIDVPMKMRNLNTSPNVDAEVLVKIAERFIDHGIATSSKSRPKFKLSLSYSLYLLIRLAFRLYHQKHVPKLKYVVNQISSQLASTSQNVSKSNQNENLEPVIFWLSNTSEFLHIIKNDEDLQHIMSKGSAHDPEAYTILTSAIDQLFHTLRSITFSSLEHLFAGFLFTGNSDFSDDLSLDDNPKSLPEQIIIDAIDVDFSLCDGYLQYLLQACSFLMSKLRRGSVNPYLTFQLFAQLFHAISAWVFNAIMILEDVDDYGWLTRSGAKKIIKRIDRVKVWAKRQGLEESAQCYLLKCSQTCELILADRSKLEYLYKKCMSSLSLNSLQIEWILAHIHDAPPIREDWIDIIIAGAKEVNDQALLEAAQGPAMQTTAGQEGYVSLHESSDLSLPLFVPTDGYAMDADLTQQNIQFRTESVIEFLRPSVDRNDILLSRNAEKSNRNLVWNAFILPSSDDVDYQSQPENMTLGKSDFNGEQTMNKPANQPIYATSERKAMKKGNRSDIDDELELSKDLRTFQPNLDYKRLARDANIKIENIQPILLRKTSKSIGLSILSARPIGDNSNYGIYVKEVIPNGSAEADGRISIGDQLLAIGEESLIGIERSEEVGQIMQDSVRKDGYVPIVIGKESAMLHGVYHLLGQSVNNKENVMVDVERSILSSTQDIQSRKDVETSKVHDSLSEDIKNLKVSEKGETQFGHHQPTHKDDVKTSLSNNQHQTKDSGFMETDEEISKNTNEKTSEDDEKGLSSFDITKRSPLPKSDSPNGKDKSSTDEEFNQKSTDFESDEILNLRDYSDHDDVMGYRSSLDYTPFVYCHAYKRLNNEEDLMKANSTSRKYHREPFVEIETQLDSSLPPTSNGTYAHLTNHSSKVLRKSSRESNERSYSRDKAIQYFSIYDNSPLIGDEPGCSDLANSSQKFREREIVVDNTSKGTTETESIYDNKSPYHSIMMSKDRRHSSIRDPRNNNNPHVTWSSHNQITNHSNSILTMNGNIDKGQVVYDRVIQAQQTPQDILINPSKIPSLKKCLGNKSDYFDMNAVDSPHSNQINSDDIINKNKTNHTTIPPPIPTPSTFSTIHANRDDENRFINVTQTSRIKIPSPSPPPMPTADYPQYHPPEKLLINNSNNKYTSSCGGHTTKSNYYSRHGYTSSTASPIKSMVEYNRGPNVDLYQDTTISYTGNGPEQMKKAGEQNNNNKKINRLIDQLIKLESLPNRDQRAIDRLKVEIQFQKDLEERERARVNGSSNGQRSQSSLSRPYEIMTTRPSRLDSQEYDNLEEENRDFISRSHERYSNNNNNNSRNNSLERFAKKSVSFDRNLATVNLYSPPSNNTTTTSSSQNHQQNHHFVKNECSISNTIQIRPKQDNGIANGVGNNYPLQPSQTSSLTKTLIPPMVNERNSNIDLFNRLTDELKDKKRISHSNSENEFKTLKKLDQTAITNRNRPENVENLSFKEKIKLFASDIGETELKDRVKASSRQIQIQKENTSTLSHTPSISCSRNDDFRKVIT